MSEDLDFVCSDRARYAQLRHVATREGYPGLFDEQALASLSLPREIRADQYGIRFPVEHQGSMVKIEIIREARIDLDAGVTPSWSPVTCLARVDCFATKLLANSDRWADRQALSRDLIDIAALRTNHGPIPDEAWTKARGAYGNSVLEDLRRSIANLLDNESYRDRCFRGLGIEDGESIVTGIECLADDLRGSPSG